jgi:hypothetical protein
MGRVEGIAMKHACVRASVLQRRGFTTSVTTQNQYVTYESTLGARSVCESRRRQRPAAIPAQNHSRSVTAKTRSSWRDSRAARCGAPTDQRRKQKRGYAVATSKSTQNTPGAPRKRTTASVNCGATPPTLVRMCSASRGTHGELSFRGVSRPAWGHGCFFSARSFGRYQIPPHTPITKPIGAKNLVPILLSTSAPTVLGQPSTGDARDTRHPLHCCHGRAAFDRRRTMTVARCAFRCSLSSLTVAVSGFVIRGFEARDRG